MMEIDNKFILKLLSEAAEIHGFVRTMTCDVIRRQQPAYAQCSSSRHSGSYPIGIRTVPRMSCCFMENWSRCFTRKSGLKWALNLEMALNRSRAWQLGVASMKLHALSWTRPPAITGCVVPAGTWHTVEVLEPSVIYEAKDGKYGEDESESV